MNVENNLTIVENEAVDEAVDEAVEEAVKVETVERKPYVQPTLTSFSADDITESASQIAHETNGGYYS